jgi:teichuronic acid biosynthesis glycosyltransferase TuaC
LPVRALVVSNMQPDRAHPQRGRFVRDQVDALRAIDGVDVELYEFAPGKRALVRAAWDLRRHHGRERWEVVHAHYGLTAWPALAVRASISAWS